jgi:hypothetical protein
MRQPVSVTDAEVFISYSSRDRGAIRKLGQGLKDEDPDPLYWRAFICQGDPGPLY